MKLHEFIDEQTKLLHSFKLYWELMSEKEPSNFPNEMNEGDWDEQFMLCDGSELDSSAMYAAGYEESPGQFAMFYGPTRLLCDVIDCVPDSPNACILELKSDGSHNVIYRWSNENRWVR